MFGIQIPITVYHIKRTFEYDNINLSSVERAVVIVGVNSSQLNFVTYEHQSYVFIDGSRSVDRLNCSLVTPVNRQRQSVGYQ